MSTAYIINFYHNGDIETITSTAFRGEGDHQRKDITHPKRKDTFKFTINNPDHDQTNYYSVRVYTKHPTTGVETDAPNLFKYQKKGTTYDSAYVPFGRVNHVQNDAPDQQYYYKPSTNCPGSPSSPNGDTGPTTDGPPDVGSIKVGS